MTKHSNRLLLVGIILVYLSLSLYQLHLPGLHYDEAFEAVPAVQLLQGYSATTFRNNGLRLGGQLYPLMTQDYIGAVNTYLAMPFILLFGSTPAALRFMSVGVGVATLFLSYALAVQLTKHRWVGATTALLLAVNPTFVFWNRQGIFVTAVTAALGLAATICWLKRFETGRKRWAIAGSFLFGVGLYAKVLFLWMIFALIGAAIILTLNRMSAPFGTLRTFSKQTSFQEVTTAVAAFVAGCLPLIAYNIQTGGTFRNVSENATTSYYGVNNLAFGPNLAERLGQFVTLLNDGQLWYLGQVIRNWWTPVIFAGVIAIAASLAIRSQIIDSTSPDRSPSIKTAAFPFLVIGLVILASIGTVSALWITHFALLMPWPALALAVGGWFIAGRLSDLPAKLQRFLKPLLWGGLILLAGTNLWSTVRYHAALTESGGLSTHSDAIYDLSDWLAAHDTGLVVAMDWGLAAPVTYLTNGRVMPAEVFGYAWQSDVQLERRLNYFINQPEALYLWRAPDEIIFDRSQSFKTLYRPRGMEENIEEAFYERSGRPILGVTRLVEAGAASNPPQ